MFTIRYILGMVLALGGSVLAQDHYDPARALSSEELFLKEHQNKRVFTQAGERYLVLDVKPFFGGFQRHRFFPGDNLRFRVRSENTLFNEEIYSVTDSSFTFARVNESARRLEIQEVKLEDIAKIKLYRRIPWVTDGAFLLPIAGIVYIGADFFNPGIDGRRFTTDSKAILVGGGLMALGLISYKLSFPTVRINRHSRLKVLKTY